ncbi:hypothetical protein DCO58_08530 [Helicobacter saguini]|uniref:Uncharacterized protein n=1 Tax=Helicobacter saguini TaxID=1548018 RepID=A0A099BJJ9_9HELI|nr:hypothetical protein [Helicobacter saguini]MWV61631.1 hypothetical protein [Helicobacter saguini]MWV62120.1 hypothetical protein [Helicobacter saguini]MWV67208.1 hypothetical protein [Helicobacter saguini]MWV67697.1 hypothetical protein [Helicobacter saguini]MWV69560.1 hypothetical protein [Helicobacter saguini]
MNKSIIDYGIEFLKVSHNTKKKRFNAYAKYQRLESAVNVESAVNDSNLSHKQDSKIKNTHK